MKTYQEWLAEKHPEVLEEFWGQKAIRNAAAAGAIGLSGLFGGDSQATEVPHDSPVVQQSQLQKTQNMTNKNVRVKQGYLFARGFAQMKDQTPQSKINAMRQAENKALVYMAGYLNGSSEEGGTIRTQGHVPGTKIITQEEKNGGIEIIIRTSEPLPTNSPSGGNPFQ